jgi:hypothetical protein
MDIPSAQILEVRWGAEFHLCERRPFACVIVERRGALQPYRLPNGHTPFLLWRLC